MSNIASSSGDSSGGGRHACAACRHQRKRCEEDCVMAPYFTADKEEEFKAVHKLFGVSNMTKLLKQLDGPHQRAQAVQSFVWEAYMWKHDPVNGPLGMYRALEREVEMLKHLLNNNNNNNNNNCSNPPPPLPQRSSSSAVVDHHGYPNGFTSLLHSQEGESSKGTLVASTYPNTPITQPRSFQGCNSIGIGMESTSTHYNSSSSSSSSSSYQFPIVYPPPPPVSYHTYRPVQLQGRGGGMMACNINGVVYDSIGHIPRREFGAMGIGPAPSEQRRGGGGGGAAAAATQGYAPYDQHWPIHVPRQDENHQNFLLQQWNSSSSQPSSENLQDAEQNNPVKNEKP